MTLTRERVEELLLRAVLAGFRESAEGFNGEYPSGMDDEYVAEEIGAEAIVRALLEKED